MTIGQDRVALGDSRLRCHPAMGQGSRCAVGAAEKMERETGFEPATLSLEG